MSFYHLFVQLNTMFMLCAFQMSAILDKFPSFRLVLEFVKESSWCQHKYVASL